MQQQAIVMAVMRGRADSLREFVNTEIEDQSRRKSLLDTLDAEQIDVAAYKGDVEELQKLLPQIRRKEERARAMTQIAVVLEKKGNHDEALKLLDEAQTLIKTDLNSETQTNALLALVAAYALVEPAKAFGIVERGIDTANDEIAKALLLDKIAKSGAVKKGEIRLQQSGMIPIDFAVFKYGNGVAALANADFDRTKAAADRFERNELRLMVRLLLARALLRSDDQTLKND
jgi:tetratricopeptide (TPR) repeat protein